MRLDRPPFIIALPGDSSGCSHHRIRRPLTIMSRNGVCAGRADAVFLKDEQLRAIAPTVVVFQRQSDEGQVAEMDRYRSTLGKDCFFVYELDDALSAVPDKSFHKPFMTPNIDSKTRNAVKRCDVVTVSTQDLADHMKSICEPGTVIRVVPNELGRDDAERCIQVRRAAPKSFSPKLRVGWSGGIGHIGDFDLLNLAFTELKDEVEWVFMGMNPVTPEGTKKTFMGTGSLEDYLAGMAAMNVDVMVAPLEDNLFNRCKSNLKLLEYGLCNFPVIASPRPSYLLNSPPVAAYAETPEDWVEELRKFAKTTASERGEQAEQMRRWVCDRYIMDDHPEQRLLQWLPDHTRPFKPKLHSKGSGLITVATSDDLYAQFRTTNDILYIRQGTLLPEDAVERLKDAPGDIVITLSNDGGPWGFPSMTSFTPVDQPVVENLNTSCQKLNYPPLPLKAASGPVVLLRRSALDAIGMPDLDSLSVEVALLEWSVAAKARGLALNLLPTVFAGATQPYKPVQGEAEMAAARINLRWPTAEVDESKIGKLRTELELVFHRDFYTSLPPQDRSNYSYWAAFKDEFGPETVEIANQWAWKNLRHLVDCIKDGVQVPAVRLYGYSNDVFTPAHDAQWTFFHPDTAKVSPIAAPLLIEAIHANPSALIIYADHDFVTDQGLRVGPDFKSNLDLHLLAARDYVSQAICVRSDLIPPGTEITEAYLYDLTLKTILAHGRESIAHCPRVLAHLKPVNTNVVPPFIEDKLKSAQDFAAALQWPVTISHHRSFMGLRMLSYHPPVGTDSSPNPKAHIIIPTKDNVELIAPCVNTIRSMTTYNNFHITVVDNGSTHPDYLDWRSKQNDPLTSFLDYLEKFNWSKLNNWAVAQINPAPEDILVFLNDDTRVVGGSWLRELIGAALTPGVGCAGAKLTYPQSQIQHIGLTVHNGLISSTHKGLQQGHPGINCIAALVHEATAITGACLAIKASLFNALNGFDESLPNNFNDAAFGLELRKRNLVNLVAIEAELNHIEGATRRTPNNAEGMQTVFADLQTFMQKHGSHPDPYWNPNLALFHAGDFVRIGGSDMNIYSYPPPAYPWESPKPKRILLIGPDAPVAADIRDGAILFAAVNQGNMFQIAAPPMHNCGPWDIRDPKPVIESLKLLEFDEIVLTQLGESSQQLLNFIAKVGRGLNVPVIYKPVNVESICPRGDMIVEGKLCGKGYANRKCLECLDEHGSPHGSIRPDSWLLGWYGFFDKIEEVDLAFVNENKDYKEAFEIVYGGGDSTDSAEHLEAPAMPVIGENDFREIITQAGAQCAQ